MRILVLGGTAWLGRTIAAEAVAGGHEVVCLARGESGAVAEGARLVVGDRDRPDASAAVDGHWDAVIDVARKPEHVRGADAALDAERYVFVSTGNVYADPGTPHLDESAALLSRPREHVGRPSSLQQARSASRSLLKCAGPAEARPAEVLGVRLLAPRGRR